MKKNIIVALLLSLCMTTYALEAKVISVTGKVQVQRGANWIDLKVGDVIRKGEMIQTGFKSEAEISLISANQNSKLTVAALSRITIEQLVEGPAADKASVYLQTGSIKSEIKKTEDRRASYTVRGPVATASVRGTIITVTSGYESLKLETTEGTAAFYETAAEDRQVKISSSDEDAAFVNLSAEEVTQNLYPVSQNASVSVSKGQSSSVSGNEKVSVAAAAITSNQSVGGATVTASSEELFSAVDVVGVPESAKERSIANIRVKLKLKE